MLILLNYTDLYTTTCACYLTLPFVFADDFRVFCGDLGNEVTDEILARTFSKYPSLLKAKVVRDKKTNKSKGYGFLSFKDPNDFVKAMREMNGKLCFFEVYATDYVRYCNNRYFKFYYLKHCCCEERFRRCKGLDCQKCSIACPQ